MGTSSRGLDPGQSPVPSPFGFNYAAGDKRPERAIAGQCSQLQSDTRFLGHYGTSASVYPPTMHCGRSTEETFCSSACIANVVVSSDYAFFHVPPSFLAVSFHCFVDSPHPAPPTLRLPPPYFGELGMKVYSPTLTHSHAHTVSSSPCSRGFFSRLVSYCLVFCFLRLTFSNATPFFPLPLCQTASLLLSTAAHSSPLLSLPARQTA